jgi:DNA topoisomerase-1
MERVNVRSLFVIEAPGKVKSLESILLKVGLNAKVEATGGHLYELPDKLNDLGIDDKFIDFKRKPKRDQSIEYLRKAAREADTIYVATDADIEGDVIAWDVHEIVKDICPDILRVRLKGMDPESVEESLNDVFPVRKADAVPGRTRAIVDRLIGHSFSKDGVGVGRVSTGLLGILHYSKSNISSAKIRLVAPSKDGTNPWICQFDVNDIVTEGMGRKLSELSFPALEMKSTGPSSGSINHMGDIMVKAGDDLGMTPKEAYGSLQRMYEAGQMSYPRSGAKGVSKGAQRRLARMIKKSGFKGNSEKLAQKTEDEVHDAPYPIGDVDPSKDPRKLGDDHGVRTMVARDIVKNSIDREKQTASGKTVYDFLLKNGYSKEVSEYVAKKNWTREIGPRFPGEKTWPKSGVEIRMPETVLLEKAIKLGLGRPSTWANHIDTFMDRGLCDDNLQLTEKGKAWVNASPDALLDPRLSKLIESACDRVLPGMMDNQDQEPWSILAKAITTSLPEELSSVVNDKMPSHDSNTIFTYSDDIERIDPVATLEHNSVNLNISPAPPAPSD